jgi:hypothetical protein
VPHQICEFHILKELTKAVLEPIRIPSFVL